MRTQNHRLLSFTLALIATAALAGCVVKEGDGNDDESPTLGGSSSGGRTSGGSGGRATGGSGGSSGSGATGGAEGGVSGNDGTGGSTAGSGGSGAEGGAPPVCLSLADPNFDGDDDPSTGRPSCQDLPYADQSCDGENPAGLYLCRTLDLTAEDGIFYSAYEALAGITVDDACSSEHDAEVAAAIAGDANQPGIRADACENPAAATTCSRLAELNTEVALTDCQQSLNMLNDVGQTQVLKCMADSSLDGDPDYGGWQARFDRLCRIPAVPETYVDTQGATMSCQDLVDLFGADAYSVALCQQYDESWARGGFLDALVEELSLNPDPDGTSAEHAAYADSVLADLRRSAAPSLTGADFCGQVNSDCPAVSVEECLVRMDFLTSASQEEATACMALAPAEACWDFFLNNCALGG